MVHKRYESQKQIKSFCEFVYVIENNEEKPHHTRSI